MITKITNKKNEIILKMSNYDYKKFMILIEEGKKNIIKDIKNIEKNELDGIVKKIALQNYYATKETAEIIICLK